MLQLVEKGIALRSTIKEPHRTEKGSRFETARIGLLGCLGIAAAGVITLSVYASLSALQKNAQAVSHTQDVLLQAFRLETDLERAISEARGFAISRVDPDRALFDQAQADIDQDLIGLKSLTPDNAEQ